MSAKRRNAARHAPARPALVRPAAPPAADEKVNPAFSGVTVFNDVPQPHTMPRNYRNYADQGYSANDTVFKCVNYIASNGAAIPPRLFTDSTMDTEITSHPLLDRLARPNNEQDGVTFREAVLGWYLIAGNAFVYAIRGAGGAGAAPLLAQAKPSTDGPPAELWVLDPNTVHPMPHPQRGIVGYKFDDFDDAHNPIPAANVGHLRTWNPKDPIFGLSPIEVAALMVDQQGAARKWNLALLQNMAKPSGAWVTDAALAKAERDRLEERLNEKMAGARNAGRVPVLDAGAKWTQTSLPPSELDWLKSLQYNAGQIANLFNIPPQLIGDTSASTYNNIQEAKAASYTEGIFPALDKLYALLTMWLVPMYPDLADGKGGARACLYYDKATVEVVQDVIQARESAKATRAGQLYLQGVITLNQAQEMQGLPALGAKGNVYRIGAVLVPADKLDEYAEQSLAEPAAPPLPIAEPLPQPGAPGAPGQPAEPGRDQPPAPAPAAPAAADADAQDKKVLLAQAAAERKASLRLHHKRGGADVTHLVWECQPSACDFCLDNDGAIVEDGESFPNGCTSPDDCHRFCECSATEIAVPDGVSDDDMATLGAAGLVALYAVGYIASRHDRDVAAQAAADEGDDEGDEGDEGDDEGQGDDAGVTYAAPAKPKPPKRPRKKEREAYRRWMEAVS